MGIVDSLSAGYRFAVQRLELLIVPLLLDALLWMVPRLGVQPLLERVARLYGDLGQELDGTNPDLMALSEEMSQMLQLTGSQANLFDFLVNSSLFHVPSLLATLPGLKEGQDAIQLQSLMVAGLAVLFLGLAGMLIGSLYMNLLARALPLGEGDKDLSYTEFVGNVVRHWLRSTLFVVGVAILLVLIYVPALLGTGLLMLISTTLGSFAMMLLSGITIVVFFYLYFVVVGIVLDNLAIWPAVMRSVVLVRNNFWATLGFVIVSGVISAGMSMLLRQMATGSSLGIILALPVNAFIGTGLAMALLVFYRTRLLDVTEEGSWQQ